MIRVSIDPQEMTFHMDGHSEFAPFGSDIVCSAASMLAAALFEYVLETVGDDDLSECELNQGHAALNVCPDSTDKAAMCRHGFEMAKCGFELLCKRYPGNVVMD